MIRVLLVDDHEMVADSFRRLLSTCEDIEVVGIAGTATAGSAAAVDLQPDVALIDFKLPDANGAELAKRIRASVPGTRVLMLTGSDDPRALEATFEAGCVGYLEKTAAVDRLPAAIRAAAEGEVVIAPAHLERLRRRKEVAPGLLTPREIETLRLMAEGLSNQVVAERLFVSLNTVRSHTQTILEKLGAHSKLEAVVLARRLGLLDERP